MAMNTQTVVAYQLVRVRVHQCLCKEDSPYSLWKLVASTTIFILDYFLTFQYEVELIWKSAMRPVKALFLFSRYIQFVSLPLVSYASLFPVINLELCHGVYISFIVLNSFSMIAAEIFLSLRIYAVFMNNKRIRLLLSSFTAVAVCIILIIVSFYLRSTSFGHPPSLAITGCYIRHSENILFG
ncbi:hypothetical protein SERLA73DRAFT_176567, partial [Serpula lacrymans var. lacrymans S7.3]